MHAEGKLYPEVAHAALKAGVADVMRLWTILRAIDTEGRGWVKQSELELWCARHGISGFSSRQQRRLLGKDDGSFFGDVFRRRGEQCIPYHKLERVALALGVTRLAHDPVLVPLYYMRRLADFRAACFHAFAAGKRLTNPISRESLEQETGVDPRTQRHYAERLGKDLTVIPNSAVTGRQWIRGTDFPDGLPDAYLFVDQIDGKWQILRRMPNSYQVSFDIAPRGKLRRANRWLRREAVRQSGTVNLSDSVHHRRYYRDSKRDRKLAMKRMGRATEGDRFYIEGGVVDQKAVRSSRGRYALWSVVTVIGGELC